MVACNEETTNYFPKTPLKSQKQEEGMLVNGKKQGEWRWFYPDGKLKEVSNWNNDLAEGEAVTYYSNGNKQAIANWQEGRLNGRFRLFDSITEIVIEELTYADDTLHGPVNTYYNHGATEMTGAFEKGKKHGEYTYFDANQKPIRKEVWFLGQIKEFNALD